MDNIFLPNKKHVKIIIFTAARLATIAATRWTGNMRGFLDYSLASADNRGSGCWGLHPSFLAEFILACKTDVRKIGRFETSTPSPPLFFSFFLYFENPGPATVILSILYKMCMQDEPCKSGSMTN